MKLSPMDYARAAIANAMAEDLDLADVWLAIEQAETPAQFDANVNTIVQSRAVMEQNKPGRFYVDGQWIRV